MRYALFLVALMLTLFVLRTQPSRSREAGVAAGTGRPLGLTRIGLDAPDAQRRGDLWMDR